MHIMVVKDAAGLQPHLSAWDSLAGAAVEPNPFYEPWMLLPALRHLGAGRSFRFVLVFRQASERCRPQQDLCGFFPLERRQRYRGLPIGNLALWQHSYCFSCTPLLRADCARECLSAFLSWLGNEPTNGILLEMPLICAEGPFFEGLIGALHECQRAFTITELFARALLRPRASAQAYLQAMRSRRHWKGLQRRRMRLSRVGHLRFAALEDARELSSWSEQFLQLEACGWKGKAGTALASRPGDCAFFREMTAAAWERRRLDLVALTVDGRPVAAKCCLFAAPGAFAFKTAFDENYARFSPGILLQTELIQRFHNQAQIRWMDSCAEPDSYLSSLWIDRRLIGTIAIATGNGFGELLVSSFPLLRWLKRQWFSANPSAGISDKH